MTIVTHPHGPLTQLADNLWLVRAPTSMGTLDRHMSVARGNAGSLFLFDQLWLDDATFAQLDALGPVRTLFVPNYLHDFDGEAFAARYPAATLCAFPTTVRKLGWPMLREVEPSMVPAPVTLRPLPGLKAYEPVCEVRHADGTATQIYNDALFNIPHGSGFAGALVRWMGSSGHFHMSPLGRLLLLRDKAAFRGWLLEQAARPELRRVIMAHGEPVETDLAARLRDAANRL